MHLYQTDPVISTGSLCTPLGCRTQSLWLMSGLFLCMIILAAVNTEVFKVIDQTAIGWGRATWPTDPKYCSKSGEDMKSITLLKQISEPTLCAEGLNEEGCCGNGSSWAWLMHVGIQVNGNSHVKGGKQRSNIWCSARVCWAPQGCAVQPEDTDRGVRDQDVPAMTLLGTLCFSPAPWITPSAAPRGCHCVCSACPGLALGIICFYHWLWGGAVVTHKFWQLLENYICTDIFCMHL